MLVVVDEVGIVAVDYRDYPSTTTVVDVDSCRDSDYSQVYSHCGVFDSVMVVDLGLQRIGEISNSVIKILQNFLSISFRIGSTTIQQTIEFLHLWMGAKCLLGKATQR